MSTMLESLYGKRIVGIDVSDGDDSLRFRCEGEEAVVWTVVGDCCSHSYWHDAIALNALRGNTVTAAHSLDLPAPSDDESNDSEWGDDYIQVYGFAIVTNRGVATLAFRNSSNGYYGGWAELGLDGTHHRWRELTDNDWQAGGKNDPPTRTPEELAAEAAASAKEEFRRKVRVGLSDCRNQLATVVPGLPAYLDPSRLVDLVEQMQEMPTTSILVLGVYITRMAETTLAEQQAAVPQP